MISLFYTPGAFPELNVYKPSPPSSFLSFLPGDVARRRLVRRACWDRRRAADPPSCLATRREEARRRQQRPFTLELLLFPADARSPPFPSSSFRPQCYTSRERPVCFASPLGKGSRNLGSESCLDCRGVLEHLWLCAITRHPSAQMKV